MDQLNTWFKDHSAIFLITGLSLIVVQLSVLISTIFLCMKRAKVAPSKQQLHHEFPDSASQPRVSISPVDPTVRNDEMYPVKRSTSPITMPLALVKEHVVHPNSHGRKSYNNEQRAVENLHRNNIIRKGDSYYGHSDYMGS